LKQQELPIEDIDIVEQIPTEPILSYDDELKVAAGPNDSPACQFCECLRQLVFQAKDCIEDLKTEIDEWKDTCAEKEAELRTVYHKLFNDKVGIDKQIEFNDDVRTIHYDAEKPILSR